MEVLDLDDHSLLLQDGNASLSEVKVEDCISTLNKEMLTMGLPSLCPRNSDTYDIRMVVQCLQHLLGKHQRNSRSRENLETRIHRLESEESHHQLMQARLKQTIEQLRRDLALSEERERQLTQKNKGLAAKLKTEKEEVRRLQGEGKQRYTQCKHDLKKKERELMRLKERLNQILTDRTQGKKVGMEISQHIQRGDRKRATWQTRDKQDGELQQVLIANFEHRQEELLVENKGLRECLYNMQKEFESLLQDNNTQNGLNPADLSLDGDEVSLDSLSTTDMTPGQFEMPYDIFRPNFERSMSENYRILKSHFCQIHQKKGDSSRVNSTSDEPLSSTKVEEKEDYEQLQQRLAWYQDVIKEQEQLLQQSISNPPLSEQTIHFPDEEDQWKEREAFMEEKNLFRQEKANFDDERKRFTEAAIRLGRERESFEKERANFLTKQILQLTPFRNDSRQHSVANIPKSPRTETPPIGLVFSPEPCGTPATPSTCELYRTLGLQHFDMQNRGNNYELASPVLKHSRGSTNQDSGKDFGSAALAFRSYQGKHSRRHSEHIENVKKAVFHHECSRFSCRDGTSNSVS